MVRKNEAKGCMWCTPGAYLRRPMLRILANEVSDHFLPEAYYTDKTFISATDSPPRSAEEERVLAMSLGLRLRNKVVGVVNDEDEEEFEEE